MAIGGQLDKNAENDALLTVARALYHAMLLIDQHTDAISAMVAADFQAAPLSFTAPESADIIAIRDQWTRMLRYFRGQDAAPVQENFRPNLKKLLGAGFY